MMDKSKLTLYNDMCRLCLQKPGMNDVFTKTDLVHDIFLCTGVNIAGQDNLPRKICFGCLEIVVNAKQLRVLALANERHLKSQLNDNDSYDETNQTLTEKRSISRKSSTDSDRTVKLEIIENDTFVEEEKSKSVERKILISFEQDKFEARKVSVRKDLFDSSGAVDKSEVKKISVRKDLFDSSGAVTSSTKDPVTSIKNNLKVKIKRMKTESGDCFHYVCDICQKKFNAWKKYYLHQKTHNRNIICPLDVCGKKFATKGDLEKHVRTHTGERPFSCDSCDRRFAQRATLKSHKLSVHHAQNGTPEKCKEE